MLILPWNAESGSQNNTMTNYELEKDWIERDYFAQDFNETKIEVSTYNHNF